MIPAMNGGLRAEMISPASSNDVLTSFSVWPPCGAAMTGGGGGGFSSRTTIFGECSTIHSPPALLFLKWRLARAD